MITLNYQSLKTGMANLPFTSSVARRDSHRDGGGSPPSDPSPKFGEGEDTATTKKTTTAKSGLTGGGFIPSKSKPPPPSPEGDQKPGPFPPNPPPLRSDPVKTDTGGPVFTKPSEPVKAPSQPPLAVKGPAFEAQPAAGAVKSEVTQPEIAKAPASSETPVPAGKETPPPPKPLPPLPEPPSRPTSSPITTLPEEEEPSGFSGLKKILIIFLAVLVFLGLGLAFVFVILPRLTAGPGGPTKEVTLTYWGLWRPESIMEVVLPEWEQLHPEIKINYTLQSPKQYRERLQHALSRDEGPDIFRYHQTWLPMLQDELDPVPASVMDASAFQQVFYPVATEYLRSGANYYGIPLEVDTLALFYNQEIFDAAGATPPQTWNEFRRLAFQLTLRDQDQNIQRAGAAIGTTSNVWHWSDILGLMMLQNGADLNNPTGASAEGALDYYTIFSRTDHVWDDTLPTSVLAFASGKAAMMLGYSWDVFEIEEINPDLDYRITSVPQLPPGDEITWASFWVEGVATDSQKKTAAWEFIKFLSRDETLKKLYEAESKIRAFGEPYSKVNLASLVQSDPLVAPFVNQAPVAKSWYLCSRTFDNGLNDRMIKYFEDAVNAVNDGEASEDVLITVNEGVAQLLSQYGLSR
jgi:multiple sugar transport system substrate-binding protein